jgi:transglutaminase-like putative cysteine protease
MVYRFSWLAGIAAIALAFWELSSLLRPSTSGTPWPIAILVATLLGAGITWTAIAYRVHAVGVVVANVAGFLLTVGLLVAPSTLWVIFPTSATVDTVRFELSRALEIIRYGVEPVRPVPGLIMILAALFWTLGFLLVAGLLNNRPFVSVLTPLIVALQFAIIDRRPKNLFHLVVFVGIVALSLLAIRLDERDNGSGRLQRVDATSRPKHRPSPAITVLVVATVVLAVGSVALAGDRVPDDGLVSWRQPAGFVDGYSGSVAYNPFTSIRAGLIEQTSNPLFRAEISGADPSTVRFRTVTLDTYRNGRWMTDRTLAYGLEDGDWVDDGTAYQGETVDVEATIRIENLRQPWIPAPITPVAVTTQNEDDQRSLEVRRLDGSLIFRGDATYEGMVYAVRSEMPRYDGPTIAALALAEDGTLSPLFAAARDNGEAIPTLAVPPPSRELPDEDYWLEYPLDELGGRAFERYAEGVVGNLDTNFEKALALENWFRDSGQFTYNASVPAGNATSDVLRWLSDDEYEYARNGYCEQFATAMALLARAVGVPSRVVLGFTPGTPLNDTTVQVLDKNAHAWVELWIPEYGWMAFDPTPRSGYAAETANESLTAVLGFSPVDYVDDIPNLPLVDTSGGGIGPQIPDRGDIDRNPVLGGGATETPGGITLPPWAPFAVVGAVLVGVVAITGPAVKWYRRRRYAGRLAAGDVSAAWEDIVDRLTDLGEPIDAADTPLEAARSIDPTLVPLASAYGASLYGEREATTALIDAASEARLRAEQHLTTRYSRFERIRATYRPSRLIAAWRRMTRRRNGRR